MFILISYHPSSLPAISGKSGDNYENQSLKADPILARIGIFVLEESTEPFDFRKRFFLLALLLEAFQEKRFVDR